jgi:hypothetical protein
MCVAGLPAWALADGKVSIPMNGKAADKSAPAAKPPAKAQAKAQAKPARKAASRRAAIRHGRRAHFYDYAAAQPVYPGGWREAWIAYHGMRDVHYAPPPPPAYYDEPGLEIDRQGWSGGVGYGTSGDFVDGYGRMHYGWNNRMNGPTYNSFDQSFQHNPSMARPFQPRRMGHPIPSR